MDANVTEDLIRKQHEYVDGIVWRSEGQGETGQMGAGGRNQMEGEEARSAEEEDLHIWVRQMRKIGFSMRGLK